MKGGKGNPLWGKGKSFANASEKTAYPAASERRLSAVGRGGEIPLWTEKGLISTGGGKNKGGQRQGDCHTLS